MSSGHHSCGAIEHRSEVVPVAQLGLAGCQTHSHRQLQLPLRVDRGVHGGHRRREGRHETIARVAEQEPVIGLDRHAQHLVVNDQRRPHRLRVGLPPMGRTLHIGEQERHHPRRSSPPQQRTPQQNLTTDTLPPHIGGHPTPYASSGQLATASQTKTERLARFALALIIYGLVNIAKPLPKDVGSVMLMTDSQKAAECGVRGCRM